MFEKFFLLLSQPSIIIDVSEKEHYFESKRWFYGKPTNNQNWKLLMYDLNQICEIVLTWNRYLSNFYTVIRQNIWVYRKLQKIEVWKRLGWVMSKTLFRQSYPKYSEQSKEIM